jgi:hypothetical protein
MNKLRHMLKMVTHTRSEIDKKNTKNMVVDKKWMNEVVK